MKKLFLLWFTMCALALGYAQTTPTFSGGDGTAANPYQIANVADLQALATSVNDGATYVGQYFQQTADIDLQNNQWTPIGTLSNPFNGNYDGGQHSISNLKFETFNTTDYVGLFGYVGTSISTLKNLIITNVTISTRGAFVGGLVGWGQFVTAKNITVNGSVSISGKKQVGGVLGHASGTIDHCSCISPEGQITVSENQVGGVVGYAYGGARVTNCLANVNVTASTEGCAGGVVGRLTENNCFMSHCTSLGGSIVSTYTGTDVAHSGSVLGDILGNGNHTVQHCYGIATAEYPLVAGYRLDGSAEHATATFINNSWSKAVFNADETTIQQNGTVLTTRPRDPHVIFYLSELNDISIENNTTIVIAQGSALTGQQIVDTIVARTGILSGTLSTTGDTITISLSDFAGSGTEADPYIIDSKGKLMLLAYKVNVEYNTYNGKFFKQTANINLQNMEWTPIGSGSHSFHGSYDGNNNKISNFKVLMPTVSFVGLFGYLNGGGLIKNIYVENAEVNGDEYVGIIVGFAEPANIQNCHVLGSSTLSATKRIGGVVGYVGYSGSITNCSVEDGVVITASDNQAGAIVGDVYNTTITDCWSNASVSGTSSIGGIVGRAFGTSVISHCTSNSIVEATTGLGGAIVGGMASVADGLKVVNCYALGSYAAANPVVGGWLGGTNYTATETYVESVLVGNAWNQNVYQIDACDVLNDGVSTAITTLSRNNNLVYYESELNNLELSDGATIVIAQGSEITPEQVLAAIAASGIFSGTLNATGDTITISLSDFAGSGTEADPYIIDSKGKLMLLAYKVNNGTNYTGKYFQQTADIDLQNMEWTPIGGADGTINTVLPFKGIYDGGNYTISNLKNSSTRDELGLFGCVHNAVIKNLNIDYVSLKGNRAVGSVAGKFYTSTMTNVHVTHADINAENAYVGGLVGHGYGTFRNCSYQGDLYANNGQGGGIAGSGGFSFYDCVVDGTIGGRYWIGGICGNLQDGSGYVSHCTVSGLIYCEWVYYNGGAGGIIGSALYNYQHSIDNNYCNAEVKNWDETNQQWVHSDCPILGGYNSDGPVDSEDLKLSGNSWNNTIFPIESMNIIELDETLNIVAEQPRNNNLVYTTDEALGVTEGEVVLAQGAQATISDIQNAVDAMPEYDYYINDNTGNLIVVANMAKIGTTGYSTLAAAVAAAQDGDVVTLLQDAEGTGIFVAHDSYTTNGIVINLNNHTYTCTSGAVGSTGTENQAWHLEKNNIITIQNGTLNTTGNSGVSMLIQNYSNLTLNDVTADGVELPGDHSYTLSNNCGNIVINNSIIKAKPGSVAFDVYYWESSYPEGVSVTLSGENTQILGDIEYVQASSDLGSNSLKKTAEVTADAPRGYYWADVDNSGYMNAVAGVAEVQHESSYTTYPTLAAAVAAAQDGDVVTLLYDAEGTGIFVAHDTYTNNGIVINLNDHTYTCTSGAVGSTGTENQAWHLEKNNTITIQYGTLNTTGNSGVSMLIQNYSNLTLNDVTADGVELPGDHSYTLSNNCGDIVINNSTIKAKPGSVAFDVYYWESSYPEGVSVTLTGESTQILGDIEYVQASSDLGSNSLRKDDQVTVAAPRGYCWADIEDDEGYIHLVVGVAEVQHDNTYTAYPTLQAAIDAAENGDVVVVLTDINYGNPFTSTSYTTILNVPEGKDITIDFNGHTVKASVETYQNAYILTNNGTLTLIDQTATETTNYAEGEGGGFEMHSSVLENGSYGTQTDAIRNIGTLNINSGRVVAVNDAVLEANQSYNLTYAIFASKGTLNVNGGYIFGFASSIYQGVFNGYTSTVNIHGGEVVGRTGGIQTKMYGNAILNIDGGHVKGIRKYGIYCSDGASQYTQQINISGGKIEGGNVEGENSAICNYWANTTGTISGGELVGSVGLDEYPYYGYAEGTISRWTITGGTITSTAQTDNYAIYISAFHPSNVEILDGAVIIGKLYSSDKSTGAWTQNTTDYLFPRGGCYSEDPSTYVPAGYFVGVPGVPVCAADYYSINENSEATAKRTTLVNQTPVDTYYFSLVDAVAATQDGDVVTLLKDETANYDANSKPQVTVTNKTITIDLGGKSFLKYRSDFVKIGDNGNVTVNNGNIVCAAYPFIVLSDNATASLTIGPTAKVISSQRSAVVPFANSNIVVNGLLEARGTYATIQGSGNGQDNGTNITINPGAVVRHTTKCAIYQPQIGTLTINGGTITSPTKAVEIRGGVFNMYGGTIKSTSTSNPSYTPGTGGTVDGAALAIARYPQFDVTFNIAGGTLEGPAALFVADAGTGTGTLTGSVTGGNFKGTKGKSVIDQLSPDFLFITGGNFSDSVGIPEGVKMCYLATRNNTLPDYPYTVGITGQTAISITCPQDIVLTLDYQACDTLIDLGTPTVAWIDESLNNANIPVNATITNPLGGQVQRLAAGEYSFTWTATDACGRSTTCEQHVIINYPPCGDELTVDYQGHTYTTVRMGCECWMAENMRNKQYSDGETIAYAKPYYSELHPDSTANAETFGLLYTYASAVRVAEDLLSAPTPDANGYVQGICPEGWHIPTLSDYMKLSTLFPNDYDLRSNDQWLDNNGSNLTGFNILPAGYYNSAIDRYENLLGVSFFIASDSYTIGTQVIKLPCSKFGCPSMILDVNIPADGAYSVRCVKSK